MTDSDYPLPNDDVRALRSWKLYVQNRSDSDLRWQDELYRLDLAHEMILRSMSGHLHYAPVDITKGSRILDVGTGTGIWAIEMGMHSLHSPFPVPTPLSPRTIHSELIEVIRRKVPDGPSPRHRSNSFAASLVWLAFILCQNTQKKNPYHKSMQELTKHPNDWKLVSLPTLNSKLTTSSWIGSGMSPTISSTYATVPFHFEISPSSHPNATKTPLQADGASFRISI